MMKTLLAYIFLGFFFYSCAQVEQVQESPSDSQTPPEVMVEDGAPSWYDHAQRSYHDSAEFSGTGMAISSDSLVAVEKSTEQAKKFLEYSIDSYAENVRRKLISETSSSELDSDRFVLSLRQAVNNMLFPENDLTIEIEHVIMNGSVHRVYSRVRLDRKRALDILAPAVENDLFSRSLRQESSM